MPIDTGVASWAVVVDVAPVAGEADVLAPCGGAAGVPQALNRNVEHTKKMMRRMETFLYLLQGKG
jgi:hypothetical protein